MGLVVENDFVDDDGDEPREAVVIDDGTGRISVALNEQCKRIKGIHHLIPGTLVDFLATVCKGSCPGEQRWLDAHGLSIKTDVNAEYARLQDQLLIYRTHYFAHVMEQPLQHDMDSETSIEQMQQQQKQRVGPSLRPKQQHQPFKPLFSSNNLTSRTARLGMGACNNPAGTVGSAPDFSSPAYKLPSINRENHAPPQSPDDFVWAASKSIMDTTAVSTTTNPQERQENMDNKASTTIKTVQGNIAADDEDYGFGDDEGLLEMLEDPSLMRVDKIQEAPVHLNLQETDLHSTSDRIEHLLRESSGEGRSLSELQQILLQVPQESVEASVHQLLNDCSIYSSNGRYFSV